MKFYKQIHKHIMNHHKKYLLGIFWSFTIIKMFLLFAGFFGAIIFIQNNAHADFSNPITTCSWVTQISVPECITLLTLYNDTNGDNWIQKTNWWDIANISNWYWITLSGWHISEISLMNNMLSWVLPSLSSLFSIQNIKLSTNHINSISNDAFSGLSNLKILRLSYNNLTSLPDTLFSGLSNLQDIFLYDNHLTTLPNIQGLLNLQHIDVSENQLTNFPSLQGLTHLLTIYIQHNKLTNFPSLQGLVDLTFLYASNNLFTSISHDAFSGLSLLQRVDISNNQLTSIWDDMFSGLSNMDELSIAGNQIANLSDTLFNGLSKVNRLNIDNNQLTNLSDNIFNGLSGLTVLNMGHNQFTNLSSNLFSGLSNILSININNNLLTSIPSTIFAKLPTLEYININNNQIIDIPDNLFSGLSNILSIDVSDNQLSSLPETLTGLTSLNYISPQNNRLHTWTMSPELITFINIKSQSTNWQIAQKRNTNIPWNPDWSSNINGWGNITWNLRLEITTSSWSCSYGTSLYIGSHPSQFAAYDMTGSNFSSPFSCIDTEGLSGWTMTMQATTDLSDGAQTISKDNVSLIASPNYVSAGACITGTNQDSWVSIGSTPGTILWKYSGQWDICTITSDTVNLAVHIPASQAVGLYTGTLSLNMPF